MTAAEQARGFSRKFYKPEGVDTPSLRAIEDKDAVWCWAKMSPKPHHTLLWLYVKVSKTKPEQLAAARKTSDWHQFAVKILLSASCHPLYIASLSGYAFG